MKCFDFKSVTTTMGGMLKSLLKKVTLSHHESNSLWHRVTKARVTQEETPHLTGLPPTLPTIFEIFYIYHCMSIHLIVLSFDVVNLQLID